MERQRLAEWEKQRKAELVQHRQREQEKVLELKAKKEKGILPLGRDAKLSGMEMTEYFKRFPLSERKKQQYWYPDFRPGYISKK